MTLSDVPAAAAFRIEAVNATGEIRQRLVDMGFIRGTEGTVIRDAPLRDPIEIELRGYRVSIRREEARMLEVSLAR